MKCRFTYFSLNNKQFLSFILPVFPYLETLKANIERRFDDSMRVITACRFFSQKIFRMHISWLIMAMIIWRCCVNRLLWDRNCCHLSCPWM